MSRSPRTQSLFERAVGKFEAGAQTAFRVIYRHNDRYQRPVCAHLNQFTRSSGDSGVFDWKRVRTRTGITGKNRLSYWYLYRNPPRPAPNAVLQHEAAPELPPWYTRQLNEELDGAVCRRVARLPSRNLAGVPSRVSADFLGPCLESSGQSAPRQIVPSG